MTQTHEQKSETALTLEKVELQDDPNNLHLLLAHDALQNSLLQNYRQTEIYLQTLLLAVGAGLISVFSQFPWAKWSFLFIGPLLFLCVRISDDFRVIVKRRAATVSHLHRRIVMTENKLAVAERGITLQKLFQTRESVPAELASLLLGDPDAEPGRLRRAADELVEGGFGHTRKIIDPLIRRTFYVCWSALGLASVILFFK